MSFIIIIISIILGIGIGYIVSAPIIGHRATIIRLKNSIIPLSVVPLFVAIFIIIIQIFNIEEVSIIFSILSLLVLCYYLIRLFFKRRQKAGALLIKIGLTPRNQLALVSSLLFALFSVFQTWDFFSSLGEQDTNSISLKYYIDNLLYLTPLWLLTLFSLIVGLDSLKLRQNAICHTSRSIEWQQIKSINWDESKPHLLIIRVSSEFPSFNQEYLTFHIPQEHREKVDDILREKFQINDK